VKKYCESVIVRETGAFLAVVLVIFVVGSQRQVKELARKIVSSFPSIQELDKGIPSYANKDTVRTARFDCSYAGGYDSTLGKHLCSLKISPLPKAIDEGYLEEKMRERYGQFFLTADSYLDYVEELAISKISDGGDERFSHLNYSVFEHMPNLTSLKLFYSDLHHSSYAKILEPKSLEAVSITHCNFSDQDAASLLRHKNLIGLSLCATGITDKSMCTIGALKHLKSLDISSTDIGNQGLSFVRGLNNLEVLNIRFTKIDGDGLKYLEGLNLRELSICLSPDEIPKLKLLSGQRCLQVLTLNTGKLSDDEIRSFRYLPKLNTLTIVGADLSSRQRKYLEKLGMFKYLI
jgi:hypothetical protein